MSYNVFVKSSIHNFGSWDYDIIKEELAKVENPQYIFDDGDLIIKDDFDMRHIRALQKASDRNWERRQKENIKNLEIKDDNNNIVLKQVPSFAEQFPSLKRCITFSDKSLHAETCGDLPCNHNYHKNGECSIEDIQDNC